MLKVSKTKPFSKHNTVIIGTTQAGACTEKSGYFDRAEFIWTNTNTKVLI